MSSHAVLEQAPQCMYLAQQNISQLRLINQSLSLQIYQLQQILYLIVMGQRIWRRYFRKIRRA
ncbi:hypothetical protein [Calothrix sp. 336/3]|uniref:hypothetical protein n=1 Tax=Calothrix sp. 336/3 TaxID=1337936 RepID=UPI000AD098B5|nr:hypothetical protein [Calothrix sp. 336/3]